MFPFLSTISLKVGFQALNGMEEGTTAHVGIRWKINETFLNLQMTWTQVLCIFIVMFQNCFAVVGIQR